MQRVEMVYFGKRAMVDADMVKKLVKKESLVAEAMALKDRANTMSASDHAQKMSEITMKIIRLNRTIRSTVSFI